MFLVHSNEHLIKSFSIEKEWNCKPLKGLRLRTRERVINLETLCLYLFVFFFNWKFLVEWLGRCGPTLPSFARYRVLNQMGRRSDWPSAGFRVAFQKKKKEKRKKKKEQRNQSERPTGALRAKAKWEKIEGKKQMPVAGNELEQRNKQSMATKYVDR